MVHTFANGTKSSLMKKRGEMCRYSSGGQYFFPIGWVKSYPSEGKVGHQWDFKGDVASSKKEELERAK
jgi:hypothetical protein